VIFWSNFFFCIFFLLISSSSNSPQLFIAIFDGIFLPTTVNRQEDAQPIGAFPVKSIIAANRDDSNHSGFGIVVVTAERKLLLEATSKSEAEKLVAIFLLFFLFFYSLIVKPTHCINEDTMANYEFPSNSCLIDCLFDVADGREGSRN
jgi:hypothetical protein